MDYKLRDMCEKITAKLPNGWLFFLVRFIFRNLSPGSYLCILLGLYIVRLAEVFPIQLSTSGNSICITPGRYRHQENATVQLCLATESLPWGLAERWNLNETQHPEDEQSYPMKNIINGKGVQWLVPVREFAENTSLDATREVETWIYYGGRAIDTNIPSWRWQAIRRLWYRFKVYHCTNFCASFVTWTHRQISNILTFLRLLALYVLEHGIIVINIPSPSALTLPVLSCPHSQEICVASTNAFSFFSKTYNAAPPPTLARRVQGFVNCDVMPRVCKSMSVYEPPTIQYFADMIGCLGKRETCVSFKEIDISFPLQEMPFTRRVRLSKLLQSKSLLPRLSAGPGGKEVSVDPIVPRFPSMWEQSYVLMMMDGSPNGLRTDLSNVYTVNLKLL